ncbi:high mobility group protein B1-like [Sycon ciliatum]|uniref:high mobility group protein B1-like n=1 Tax=Sycon ciliatum TaxID=27933 RepID=UPI0031F688E2
MLSIRSTTTGPLPMVVRSMAAATTKKAAAAKKPAAKPKPEKGPTPPKRAPGAMALFVKDRYNKPAAASPTDYLASLAKQWRQTSEAEKGPYQRAHEEARKKWLVEIAKFRAENAQPVRARSSYIYFTQEQIPKLRAQNPGMAVTQIVKSLGSQWQDMSASAKAPYTQQAEKDRVRAAADLAAFEAKQSRK